MIQAIKSLLAEPATRGLSIDDPATTAKRRQIVREKTFLHGIYQEWYQKLADALPPVEGLVLELGSGAGFLEEVIPGVIRSEVFPCPGIDAVLDARRLPFPARSLRAIVMTDVLHHIPDVERFLGEAHRCLVPGGRILMVEPWVSSWSKLIYQNLHHEEFVPEVETWAFPDSGPLSSANGALPWVVFQRDRHRLERMYPTLEVGAIEPMMPFRYLISGGVSLRCLAPGATFGLWRAFEKLLRPWMPKLAMFAFIQVNRKPLPDVRPALPLEEAHGVETADFCTVVGVGEVEH